MPPALAISLTAPLLLGPGGVHMPRLIYGTAWKKEATADLVYTALQAGFRGIDTANQPRHYREDLVGEGVRRALADGVVAARDRLYIQTKFTPLAGQDPDPRTLPYDAAAPLAEQVRASVAASLRNFDVAAPTPPYLDCVLLHSPLERAADTRTVLAVLGEFVPEQVRCIGISNVGAGQLEELFGAGKPELSPSKLPSLIQNRFHGRSSPPFDTALRRFCARQQPPLCYQSFWTLTANPRLLRQPCVLAVAAGARVSPEVALYALVMALGRVAVLDGTTTQAHMEADLAGMQLVQDWGGGSESTQWQAAVAEFRNLIGDEPMESRSC